MSFASFIYVGFAVYISFIVEYIGGSPTQTGVVVMITSIVYTASSTQAGRLADCLGNRVVPLIIASSLQGFGIVFIAVVDSLNGLWIAGVVIGLGQGLINPLYRSIITDISPEGIRGAFVGIAETFGRIGIVASPALMGVTINRLSTNMGNELAIRTTLGGTGLVLSLLVVLTLVAARAVGFTQFEGF
jgi:MFS family permease